MGLAVYRLKPEQLALTLAGGVLIDLDHLALYCLHTGDWSLAGALHYDRYRNLPPVPGDTRPRYGQLRSALHSPAFFTIALLCAYLIPRLRPAALGLALHFLLDFYDLPVRLQLLMRTRGRCEECGARQSKIYLLRSWKEDGRRVRFTHRVLCRCCFRQYEQPGAITGDAGATQGYVKVRQTGAP